MITVVSGTNRKGNLSQYFAQYIYSQYQSKGVNVQYLSLEELNGEVLNGMMYGERSESFEAIQDKYLRPTKKYVFVLPEYNGSFPAVLKLLIDASDVRTCFYNKKACLIGVAAGRAGNLRGVDHLAGILNHMKIAVLPGEVPLSLIGNEFDEKMNLKNNVTKELLNSQIEAYLSF